MMHEPEKSDPSTVAVKPVNNPNGLGAESVERREGWGTVDWRRVRLTGIKPVVVSESPVKD